MAAPLPPFEWKQIDNIVVTCNRPGKVDDTLWTQYIQELASNGASGTFSLVDGTITITATQRSAAARVLKDNKLTAIVLIDDRVSRGILTAISWLGGSVQGFAWKDLDRAVAAVQTSEETKSKLMVEAKLFSATFT